ncbi:transposase [Lacrimispora sp.]|uniref:transposase n=1 Tax=Lacrimispora sp. TaxID=2719234 RepID=UPI002898C535|nr:transposase [Lacrimispora sp.]
MTSAFITQSLARCLEQQKEEIALVEAEIKRMLQFFDYKLTTISGISIAIASKLIAEIGDINRFRNAE